MISLVRCDTRETLVERLFVKTTFWGRFRGSLFYRNLDKDSAILLIATRRVHTCGMLFPLDLYFFDSSMVLINSCQRVRPYRLPPSPQDTNHILEVQHREGTPPLKLSAGDKVSILWKVPQ